MAKTLQSWIDYIQTIHAREIDLSLDRVQVVFSRLFPDGLNSTVITIAGTNGKGSTAEVLNSIYLEANYQVGKYSSPHLVRFNERIEVNGKPVSDQELLEAFDLVENAREQVPLTFFEFGTLVAWVCFERANIEICLLEVGLGGRLDATNIVDADVAVLTNVSLDHTAWLGDTLELIAREKVGIARPGTPLIIGMRGVPNTALDYAKDIEAEVIQIGSAFDFRENSDSWNWSCNTIEWQDLPLPFGQKGVQLYNAACALMVIESLQEKHPIQRLAVDRGLATSTIRGRCQVIQKKPLIVLDVSHNEASLKRLASFVSARRENNEFSGNVLAVCGMLKDKDITTSMSHIADQVDAWFIATIDMERGATADEVKAHLPLDIKASSFDDPVAAYVAANEKLDKCDCLLVFGSFHIAGDILAHLGL